MKKRLLAVFAHPDDESFSSGGTLAKYAQKGVEIYLACVTRGEVGQSAKALKKTLGEEREKELLRAAKILGVKGVFFLGFSDGTLNNQIMPKLWEKILKLLRKIRPQVVLTFDFSGISGHLDHIATSYATTLAFLEFKKREKKLYWVVIPERFAQTIGLPFLGMPEEKITTKIDISRFWPQKVRAIKAHKTQKFDWERFFARRKEKKLRQFEYFYLAKHSLKKIKLPEADFFSGFKKRKS